MTGVLCNVNRCGCELHEIWRVLQRYCTILCGVKESVNDILNSLIMKGLGIICKIGRLYNI